MRLCTNVCFELLQKVGFSLNPKPNHVTTGLVLRACGCRNPLVPASLSKPFGLRMLTSSPVQQPQFCWTVKGLVHGKYFALCEGAALFLSALLILLSTNEFNPNLVVEGTLDSRKVCATRRSVQLRSIFGVKRFSSTRKYLSRGKAKP